MFSSPPMPSSFLIITQKLVQTPNLLRPLVFYLKQSRLYTRRRMVATSDRSIIEEKTSTMDCHQPDCERQRFQETDSKRLRETPKAPKLLITPWTSEVKQRVQEQAS